ncbi:hypothetical protein [Rhodococcus sp. DMU1]|uniref:hypothetical protein n=1 Tax=Rhodococcus sp. DMU1 TaxID=2722825 RepID=UPI00143E8A2A|nr:hypothetical protein [Rhodococcus sp. DMU1]QIX53723.1 hypothetical protein HFP48_29395 [Rhodococcus sp. DMU1]
MVEAIRKVPAAPIYGIVVTDFGGEPYEYEVGWDDAERDFQWALHILRRAGVASDDYILCTTPNHELPWTSPFIRAFREIGATYVPAEQHSWDSRRFLAMLDRLPVTVVFGLWPETLNAIADSRPDLQEVFSDTRLIWARPEARRQLSAAGVQSLPFALLGPAVGIGLPDDDGMQVNGNEWEFRSQDGDLVVSAKTQRRARLVEVPTGVRATVTATEGGGTLVRLS